MTDRQLDERPARIPHAGPTPRPAQGKRPSALTPAQSSALNWAGIAIVLAVVLTVVAACVLALVALAQAIL